MRFSSHRSEGVLSGFVDNFWLYEGYEAEHLNERILPTGTFELVINLRENELRIYDAEERAGKCGRFSGAVVSGAYGKGFVTDAEEEHFIIGVHFKPGGAAPFLGLPAAVLANTHVDLEGLWGQSAKDLRERLCNAATATERFSLLEAGLKDHLAGPLEHHYAVSTALDAFKGNAAAAVRDIARDTGLSQRRFIEVFKNEIGMTPKLFSRVQRFQQTRATIHKLEGEPDWAGIAMDHGYFDQSHLIRDFHEFSGVTPAAYLRQYNRFLDRDMHIKRYHLPLFSKVGQFYPIHPVSCDDIISLGGNYVGKS